MDATERFNQDAPTDRLLAFIEFLRGRDIIISPADSLVAMEVAGLVGYSDRTLLKNGLGSALAKSKFEIDIFDAAFEQYFGAPASNKEAQHSSSSSADDDQESDPPSPQTLAEQLSQAMQAQPELAANLSRDFVDAPRRGDDSAIAIAV